MADEKDAGKASDKRTTGPKTEDSSREGEVSDPRLVAGADQNLADSRTSQFGDHTSSTGGANNPGQHGRDGGEINGVTNNPAPSEAAVAGETAPTAEETAAEEEAAPDTVKKL